MGISLHTAKCILMDVCSYARWRQDEIPPESLSDKNVADAIEVLWIETFGEKMEFYDKTSMRFPEYLMTEEDLQNIAKYKDYDA